MVLPRWLQSLTEPIGIDDVVAAWTARPRRADVRRGIGHPTCCSFDEAARRALDAEKNAEAGITGFWREVEAGVRRWHGMPYCIN